MNTQDENRDIDHNSAYNPFPEPQTIPAGWDMSAFLSTPEPAPVQEADDSTES
ncbi:MAG: hypothetical protein IPN58_19690 [Anaerolineales bacterium]|nr:hypothetical protein [Anaerolineales bacterium]